MSGSEDDIPELEYPSDEEGSDEEVVDETRHGRLLNAISALDGTKKRTSAQRTEPAGKVSEFYVTAGQGKVELQDLVKGQKDSKLNKQLNRINKSTKILPVPLPRQEREKIERTVAFDNARTELKKWDPIVKTNRTADQLTFPLERPDVRMVTMNQFVQRFTPRTPLEVEVAKLLNNSDSVINKGQTLSKAEERALQAMSIEEAEARRAELKKYRALLSYKEAKAHRRNKIKSKNYRRHLRKDRVKQEKKALDELQKTDPLAYEEKLKKIEKEYLTERMSLKHRGGSKYMQKQIIYGKYDKDARQSVQEMLQKSRELTQKVNKDDSDSDSDAVMSEPDVTESEEISSSNRIQVPSLKNPWMSASTPKPSEAASSSQVEVMPKMPAVSGNVIVSFEQKKNKEEEDSEEADDEESQQKHLSEKKVHKSKKKDKKSDNKPKGANTEEISVRNVDFDKLFEKKIDKSVPKKKQKKEKYFRNQNSRDERMGKKTDKYEEPELSESSDSEMSDSDSDEKNKVEVDKTEFEEEPLIKDSLTRKRTLEDVEGEWSEEEDDHSKIKSSQSQKDVQFKDKPEEVTEVDPSKFMTLETSIRHAHHHEISAKDSLDYTDPEQEHRMTMSQAFASDDVVEEFAKEKAETADHEKTKDIDLTLPGWGEWGGSEIVISKKKKRRFTIKAPKAPPRKDSKLKNVIIREAKDRTISKHQVKQVPFPYQSVCDFESSIRAPLGKTWNPETAYKRMIQPDVVTRLGTVIQPIDKATTFKKYGIGKKDKETDQGKKPSRTNKKKKNK